MGTLRVNACMSHVFVQARRILLEKNPKITDRNGKESTLRPEPLGRSDGDGLSAWENNTWEI